jgi:membrane associated rhomboid family serine protease
VYLSITLILIAATTLTSAMAFQRPALKEALLFSPYAVLHQGQWYRLFSHAFVHADWGHLLVNMFVLWSFGSNVELLYPMVTALPGAVAYGVLYVGGVLFATLPGMAKHRDDPRYRSVGASGAVSAVLFAQILLMPTHEVSVFFIQDLPAWVFGLLYLAYSYAMDKRGGDNVAHDAHFYGAVFGLLFTAALDPDLVFQLGYLQHSLGI